MSRVDFGPKTWIFPEPALVVCTYNEDGTVDAMPAAWAGMCQTNPPALAINLEKEHKTTANILRNKAFTIAIPTVDTAVITDYFGIVSGNKMPDKFEKSGCHAHKSSRVNAPVIEEYKMVLECECTDITETADDFRFVGKIVNVSADESVLTDGKIDQSKLDPIAWNPVTMEYTRLGEPIGKAWNIGGALLKK